MLFKKLTMSLHVKRNFTSAQMDGAHTPMHYKSVFGPHVLQEWKQSFPSEHKLYRGERWIMSGITAGNPMVGTINNLIWGPIQSGPTKEPLVSIDLWNS